MRTFSLKIILLIGLLVVAQGAWAASHITTGNPDDTPAGTLITAEPVDATIGYGDLDGSLMPTVEVSTGTIEYTADAEYGFSALRTVVDQLALAPGDVFTHETYSVTNEGNSDDSGFNVYSLYTTYEGANNWTVELVSFETDATIATLTAGTTNTYSPGLLDNDDVDFYYRVTVPSDVADAPDLSSIEVITTIETTSDPAGEQYAGGNGLTYGGSDEVEDIFVDQVSAPALIITRSFVVDPPDEYEGRPGGGSDHRIPGAVITFTYVYSNEGSGSAESVVLIDKIPTAEGISGTNLAHIDAAATTHNGVTLSHGGQSTATGWNVYYSTVDSPSMSYGDYTNWTTVGAVDGTQRPGNTTLYDYNDTEFAAKWIKFENPQIDGNDLNKTLVWGVTIR